MIHGYTPNKQFQTFRMSDTEHYSSTCCVHLCVFVREAGLVSGNLTPGNAKWTELNDGRKNQKCALKIHYYHHLFSRTSTSMFVCASVFSFPSLSHFVSTHHPLEAVTKDTGEGRETLFTLKVYSLLSSDVFTSPSRSNLPSPDLISYLHSIHVISYSQSNLENLFIHSFLLTVMFVMASLLLPLFLTVFLSHFAALSSHLTCTLANTRSHHKISSLF